MTRTLEDCDYIPWDQHDPPLATKQCVHWVEPGCKRIMEGKKCPKPWVRGEKEKGPTQAP